MKIKLNDTVLVIAGKNKGKKGKVIKKFVKQDKIVVEKVNIHAKHTRKTTSRAGERIYFETPIHVSNVKIICPQCKKLTRISYNLPMNGKKERICKKCKTVIDQTVKK